MSYKREGLKLPIPVSHHASVQSTFERFVEKMGGNCIYSAIVHHPLEGELYKYKKYNCLSFRRCDISCNIS